MADTTSRWSIQEVFDWTVLNVANTQVYGTVDDLQSCSLSNEQANYYSHGGKGDPYRNAFSGEKRVEGEAVAGSWDNSIVALITGTDEVVGSTSSPYSEVLSISSDASATTYTATGTVGAEIIGLFLLNDNGTLGTELTQVSTTLATGKFTYATGTKALAFFASDYDDATQIKVFYQYATGTGTRTLSNKSDAFSKIVRIEMTSLVQDTCGDREEYAAKLIVFAAKFKGNFSLNTGASDDPATLDLSFQALQASCGNTSFWDLQIIDPPA